MKNKKINCQDKKEILLLFILFDIILILFLFSISNVNGFTNEQNQLLDQQCIYYNYSYTQCQTYRTLWDYNDTISNETILVEQLNKSIQNELNKINEDLDNLDFSEYNDSKLINLVKDKIYLDLRKINSTLLDKYSVLESRLNKFSGNNTEFDFDQLLNARLKVQQIQKYNEMLDKAFTTDDKSGELKLNLNDYYNKSQVDLKLNSLPKPKSINTSEFVTNSKLNIIYILLFLIGIVLGLFYVQEYLKLKQKLERIIIQLNNQLENQNKEKQENSKDDSSSF